SEGVNSIQRVNLPELLESAYPSTLESSTIGDSSSRPTVRSPSQTEWSVRGFARPPRADASGRPGWTQPSPVRHVGGWWTPTGSPEARRIGCPGSTCRTAGASVPTRSSPAPAAELLWVGSAIALNLQLISNHFQRMPVHVALSDLAGDRRVRHRVAV